MPRPTGKIKLDSKIKLDGAFAFHKVEPPRYPLLPGGLWLWCLLGLAVGLTIWLGGRSYLRNQLAAQLASAQTEQTALQSIDALLRLDGDATIDVSRGLTHPEFMVANAAYRALNQQLDAWSSLLPAEQLRRMNQIVTELQRVPVEIDQDHRILVTGLASRIYALALSNREPGAAQMLATCKRLMALAELKVSSSQANSVDESTGLDRSAALDRRSIIVDLESPVPPPLPPLLRTEPTTLQSTSGGSSSTSYDARSTNSLSLTSSAADSSGMPRLTSSSRDRLGMGTGRGFMQLTATPVADAAANSPGAMADHESVALLNSSSSPDVLLSDQASTRSKTLRSGALSSETNGSLESQREAEASLSGIDDLPIDQLVRLLPSLQPRVSQAASLALRRKGMTDQNLDLAMRLAVGSASERQALLNTLVQRDDLDPRPWLLWMAADGELQVREQAIGLLSPLLDTEVRRQLRLLLNKERDEQVAQAMRRVLLR